MNNTMIATGSVVDHAKRMNSDLATSFLDVQLILLCDRSGSMLDKDARSLEFGSKQKARYEIEDELVAQLQLKHQGKILLASFASYALIHPDGLLPAPSGSTFMLDGLKKILPYTVGDIRVILLSDGEPSDSENQIVSFAMSHYMDKLDTMFCGLLGSPGEVFLKKLAAACMGTHQANVLNHPILLSQRVDFLLTSGVAA